MSQGGKLKSGGRGRGGHGGRTNQHSQWGMMNKTPRQGLFMLSKDATATTTNNWLEAIKDWANVELKHGVGELARPHQPGPINQPNEPARPNHDALDENDEFVYAHAGEDLFADGGELTARGMAMYKEDFDLYKQRMSVYEQIKREIDDSKLKLHGKLESQLGLDARTEVERKYGSEIYLNKDPVALIDAIKTVFVGQTFGGGEGKMSRASLWGDLNTIKRASGESQLMFSRRFQDTVESYRHAELQAEREAEAIEAELNDQTLTRLYILGCELNEWKWSLTYEPQKEPYPESLADAIKRAKEIEEGMAKKKKSMGNQQYDMQQFQAFVAHQQQQHKTAKDKGKSQMKPHDQQEKKAGPCHSFHKTGTCKWTQEHPGGEPCRYTHDGVTTKNDNQSSSHVASMTSAAVTQVKQRSVGFDPDSAAGGGGTGASTVKNNVKPYGSGNG